MEKSVASYSNVDDMPRKLYDKMDFFKSNPLWNFSSDMKLFIWHKFWDLLFFSDSEAYKDKPEFMGKMPPLLQVFHRLDELKSIANEVGHALYEAALLPLSHEINSAREGLLREFEGVDVYWDGGTGDRHLNSKTHFGKMYILDFPFTAVMVYDDCDDYAFIRGEDLVKLYELNSSPEIKAKVRVRRRLRALNGKRIIYPYTCYISKDIGDEDEIEYVVVPFVFNAGYIHISHNREIEWSAGFNVSLVLDDGYNDYRRRSWYYESKTLSPHEFGLFDSFEDNDRLEILFSNNIHSIEQGMVQWSKRVQQYRDEQKKRRLDRRKILSDGFWSRVYNNIDLGKEELKQELSREKNPVLSGLMSAYPREFEVLFARMNYVTHHPGVSLWFCFWSHFWNLNGHSRFVKKFEDFLSPISAKSVMYNPMTRAELERFAIVHEMRSIGGKGIISDDVLDALYGYMDQFMDDSVAVGEFPTMEQGNE